jgi:CBS domain-containing protein
VRDLMTREPVTAPANETLGEFADSLSGLTRHSTYPVVSNGDVLGLLPFGAISSRPRGEWGDQLVRDSMIASDQVPVLDSEDSAEDALAALMGGEIGRGLVVHDGHLVGFISVSDVGRALSQRQAFRQ